jgi:hypothetical protein
MYFRDLYSRNGKLFHWSLYGSIDEDAFLNLENIWMRDARSLERKLEKMMRISILLYE